MFTFFSLKDTEKLQWIFSHKNVLFLGVCYTDNHTLLECVIANTKHSTDALMTDNRVLVQEIDRGIQWYSLISPQIVNLGAQQWASTAE